MTSSRFPMQDSLSLTVMRLTHPKLTNGTPLYMEPKEPGYAQMFESQLKLHGLQSMRGVQLLQPGREPTYVPLGETIIFYVSVQNTSDVIAEQVSLKTDILRVFRAIPLPNTYHEPTHVLKPGGTLSVVVSHEFKEIGGQDLACEVNHVSQTRPAWAGFRHFFPCVCYDGAVKSSGGGEEELQTEQDEVRTFKTNDDSLSPRSESEIAEDMADLLLFDCN